MTTMPTPPARFAPPPPPPAYPTEARGVVLAGLAVIGATFGGLIAWSALAPLSSAAIAPGTVGVDSHRKTVQHFEGGVVRAILVRDGDEVAAGQTLVQLDDGRVSAAVTTLRPLLIMSRARRARLLAEREGLDALSFPDDLGRGSDPAATQILADQRRMFLTRRQALDDQVASLANRRARARATLAGFTERQASHNRRVRLARETLARQTRLAAAGHAPRARVQELEEAMADLVSRKAEYDSAVAEAREEVEYTGIEVARARSAFREAVETELQTAERETYDVTERLRAFADQNARLTIRAPVAGVVVDSAVHTVGGVVTPGGRVLDIVPNNDRLVIEAKVASIDVDGVRPGLPAEVRFPSVVRRDMPRLTGRVITVSADRLGGRDEPDGPAFFGVRVLVDEAALARARDLRLRPGMPAEVIITTGERTVLSYLFSPLLRALSVAMKN